MSLEQPWKSKSCFQDHLPLSKGPFEVCRSLFTLPLNRTYWLWLACFHIELMLSLSASLEPWKMLFSRRIPHFVMMKGFTILDDVFKL